MRKLQIATFAALSILVASPVLAQEFEPWEGKNAIQEGEGGTKKTVDGIDFWSNGAPARKFKLIGYIQDRRHKSGLVGMVRMSGLESDISKVAKKAGGDAVILVGSQTDTVGTVGHASTFGTSNTNASATASGNSAYGRSATNSNSNTTAFAAPVQKQESRFAVVKYLADEAPAAAPADPPK